MRASEQASKHVDKPTYTPEIHNIRAAVHTLKNDRKSKRKIPTSRPLRRRRRRADRHV